MSVYLVFPDRATADGVLREIAATPDLEDGIGPVWLWYDPDASANAVGYAEGADGRCMVAHPWPAVDRDWLEAYLGAWPGVLVLDAVPGDWKWISSISAAAPGRAVATAAIDPTRSAADRGNARLGFVVGRSNVEPGGKAVLP